MQKIGTARRRRGGRGDRAGDVKAKLTLEKHATSGNHFHCTESGAYSTSTSRTNVLFLEGLFISRAIFKGRKEAVKMVI